MQLDEHGASLHTSKTTSETVEPIYGHQCLSLPPSGPQLNLKLFGMVNVFRELRACTLDVLLHEQQLFHSRKFLRVWRPRQCSPKVFDRQPDPLCLGPCGLTNISDILDENFLHDVHRIGGGISIISEAVHEIFQFFGEQPSHVRLLPRTPTSRTTGCGSCDTFPQVRRRI